MRVDGNTPNALAMPTNSTTVILIIPTPRTRLRQSGMRTVRLPRGESLTLPGASYAR